MSIKKNHLLIFVGLALLFLTGMNSCIMYKQTHTIYTTKLANGQVKILGNMDTKKSLKFDRYSYYQRWDNEYYEYYPDGTVKSKAVSQFKSATYGRPCRELLSYYVAYNEDGVKILEQKDICDCKKTITKRYADDGSLLERKISRTKRVK